MTFVCLFKLRCCYYFTVFLFPVTHCAVAGDVTFSTRLRHYLEDAAAVG